MLRSRLVNGLLSQTSSYSTPDAGSGAAGAATAAFLAAGVGVIGLAAAFLAATGLPPALAAGLADAVVALALLLAALLLEDLAADYLALTAPHATARRAMPSMQTMLMCFTCRRRRMIGCCLGVLL